MDALMLSRLQFAAATFFHFLFVPLTLGLSILVAVMETKFVRTGDEEYRRMAKFWGKVFIIWIGGVVPCVINAWAGVKMTNPTLIQMARTYGATDWQIFKKLCIPSALPMVFGALQITLAICWTNLVAAELLAADSGLGFLISMGRRLALPEMVVLGMVTVGVVGALIGVVIDIVEKRLLAGIRR